MFFGVYNESVNEEVLEETKRFEELMNSDVIKGIKPKDVDSKDKIDKLIYKLQKENDEKSQKYAIKAFGLHLAAMLGTAVTPICIPLGIAACVVCVANAVIMLVENGKLPGSELGVVAKRLENRIEKMEKEGCDKKDIEAVKKVLAKVEEADMKNRKEGK